ncbi:hypothetical protein C6503_25280 [Candidatus Poribacteria bacterium]|nr:MAG: hypothetical protein C6503_25280 [Candidatus Poribacteria bacterium]
MKLIYHTLSTFLIFAPLSAVLAKAPETAKIVFRSRRDGNLVRSGVRFAGLAPTVPFDNNMEETQNPKLTLYR